MSDKAPCKRCAHLIYAGAFYTCPNEKCCYWLPSGPPPKEVNMSGRPSDHDLVAELVADMSAAIGVTCSDTIDSTLFFFAARLAALAPVTPAGSQAVKSAAGQLPEGAIAWLDMGKGEAELLFTKKGNSNRANSRQLMALFKTVSPGWHPLYLHPVTPASGAVDDGMVERYCDAVAEYLGSLDEAQWAKHRKDRAVSLRRVARVGLAAALTHSTEEPQP